MTSRNIDIAIEDERWSEKLPHLQALSEEIIEHSLRATEFPDDAVMEINIVFESDAFIQNLNKQYRGKDKPTNVLSFPQINDISAAQTGNLGDIVLAYETVEHESEEQGKTFEHHTQHLLVHGVLHLLGFDHENDDEAEEMEGLEIEILQALGIKNPYETDKAVS